MKSAVTQSLKHALMISLGISTGGCEQGEQNEVTLDPIPQEEMMCTGEEGDFTGEEGDYGPCCVDVYCTDTDESGSCPDASPQSAMEVLGLGSGQCQCSEVSGPYAPASSESELPCCYLVGIQWCVGRPIYAEGITVRATAVHGERWFG
jgi:hypothetical protein